MEVCRVCRRSVPHHNRAVMGAFGKALFVVHAQPCAVVVQGGVATIGRVVLTGANLVLKARAPKAFALLQGVRTAVRRTSDDSQQQPADRP